MRPLRKASAAVVALALPLLLALPAHAALGIVATEVPGGRTMDSLGRVVENVEILFVDPTSTARPIASALSDATGRFSAAGLPPDVYRVAAIKDGYLTAVATFDTTARSWIDIVLHPGPERGSPAAARLPLDADWVLRAPRRSVLRETDATAGDGDAESAPAAAPAADDSWRLRIDQLFALGSEPGASSDASAHGSETYVRVDSSIGERGAIQVDGRRQSLDAVLDGAARSAEHDTDSLNVAFSYDTSLDSTVRMNAYYDQAGLSWDMPAVADVVPIGLTQERRSWGWDAAWQTQLDDRSSLQVSMDYRGGSLQALEEFGADGVPGGASDSHAMAAGGRYETLPAVDHQVRVDFRAQVTSASATAGPILARRAAPASALYGRDGVSLGIDAQDTWFLGGPFSVRYGLGYRHAMAAGDASLLVPRIGGTIGTDAAVVRVMLSYHAVTQWTDEAGLTAQTFRPEQSLGWTTEVEVPIGHGVSVRAGAAYTPIQMDVVAHGDSGVDEVGAPLFVTDGNAAVDRRRVALVKEAGGARTYFEMETGEARGTLAAYLPFDTGAPEVADRDLRFRTGRIGVRFVPTGTDLLLEYRRVVESARHAADLDVVEQRALELRLVQELMRRPTIGRWRLLVALRAASAEADVTEVASADRLPPIDPAGHRVSAGLSVLF